MILIALAIILHGEKDNVNKINLYFMILLTNLKNDSLENLNNIFYKLFYKLILLCDYDQKRGVRNLNSFIRCSVR